MCPCPFCTTVAILLCPLLLFPTTRKWLKSKLKHHHKYCECCQKAEHARHMQDHTPCSCQVCVAQAQAEKPIAKGRRGRPVGTKNKAKRRGRPARVKTAAVQAAPAKRRGRPARQK